MLVVTESFGRVISDMLNAKPQIDDRADQRGFFDHLNGQQPGALFGMSMSPLLSPTPEHFNKNGIQNPAFGMTMSPTLNQPTSIGKSMFPDLHQPNKIDNLGNNKVNLEPEQDQSNNEPLMV